MVVEFASSLPVDDVVDSSCSNVVGTVGGGRVVAGTELAGRAVVVVPSACVVGIDEDTDSPDGVDAPPQAAAPNTTTANTPLLTFIETVMMQIPHVLPSVTR